MNSATAKNLRTIKLLFGLILLTWGTAVFLGCEDCDDCLIGYDSTPPAVPRGLYSVTGDEAVFLYWYPNDEYDLDFYVVYRSIEDNEGPYYEIGKVYWDEETDFVDRDVTNGNTYYYAVSAVDESRNESDLSYDYVPDTPRPEGSGVRVYDYYQDPTASAFDFSRYQVVDGDDPDADVWFDYFVNNDGVGAFFINVQNDQTDIQDYGYTSNLDAVDWSPEDGWSEIGYSELILGHSYIIWTADNHFAKLRVTDYSVAGGWVKFDWAYQVDRGNPELAPKRPAHDFGYGQRELAQFNKQNYHIMNNKVER
ncbi:MAG: hypothetical protein GF404_04400 [candidate division Zixibacteria bacterium]|nr:hypothetical protein [candidate division Zixibacteria bacterium]